MKQARYYYFIASVVLFLQVQGQDWFVLNKSFFGDFPLSDFDHWIVFNPSQTAMPEKHTCGSDFIAGGFGNFGQGTQLRRQFSFLPPLTQVRLKATLYFIDQWENPDFIETRISNFNSATSPRFFKEPAVDFQALCGNDGELDLKRDVEVLFNTVQDLITVQLRDNLFDLQTNESWGVNNLSIEYFGICDGEVEIDQDGFQVCNIEQRCFEHLKTFNDGEGNLPINSFCIIEEIGSLNQIEMNIQLLPPYTVHDPECLQWKVFFGGREVQRNPFLTTFFQSWRLINQTITFRILFNIIEDGVIYDCAFIEEPDKFTWICNFSVEFFSIGELQATYSAKLMICVNRLLDGELDGEQLVIDVQKNTVIGECCENELNIQTELNFCSSSDCSEYLPDPITIARKESFFVEQRITTPGFQSYFLELVQVELGEFFPNVLNIDDSQPGRLIIELSSSIAKPDLILSVISRLLKKQTTLRQLRFLQDEEQEIGENYRVRSYNQISIIIDDSLDLNKEQEQQQQKIVQSQQFNPNLNNLQDMVEESSPFLLIIIGCSVVGLVLLGVIIEFVIKNKKLKKQKLEKYNENQANDQKDQIQKEENQ